MRWMILAMMATQAQAGTFQVPPGCTGAVSIQLRGCMVTHYYRCDADPAGFLHRVDMSEDGLEYYALTDGEGRWLRSHDVVDNYAEELGTERDPASLTELRQTGLDSFDFDMRSGRGDLSQIQGYDSLTGETVTIDGETLRRTEFQMSVRVDGEVVWSTKGREFVYDRLSVFLGGQSTVTHDDDSYDRDSTPERFDFPGEPGFMSTQPVYGCSLNLARAVQDGGLIAQGDT